MNRSSGHWLLMAVGLCLGLNAHAAVRAWLNPDRIQMGQTTTLSVETDQAVDQAPDLSALQASFNILGQSSNTQTTVSGAGAIRRTTFLFELEPKQPGVIGIPALSIGTEQTAAISLTVLPAQPGSAASGDLIYLESQFDTTTPYVQQGVRYTVRLFYAVPLINGGVDAPAPENAVLQTLGEERNFQQQVGGRTYSVFERSYLLVAERSGTLNVPAPVFRGRARSGNVDPFFDRGQNVSASGQLQTLDVRPQPANAPDPWLPASSARFSRAEIPQQGKVGEPLTLELTLDVEGIAATQLPELTLPDIPGAQVFPEAPQQQDSLAQGQLRAQIKRRFAIVPNTAGSLVIPELRVPYWNTTTDQLDAATLPQLDLQIAAGAVAVNTTPVPPSAAPSQPMTEGAVSAPTAPSAVLWPWQLGVLLLSIALLGALAWGWRRGARQSARSQITTTIAPDSAEQRLATALHHGDLQQISLALARRQAPNTASQLALIAELQMRLWSASGAGSANAASDLLQRLRKAFPSEPRSTKAAANDPVLPELYPQRG